MMKKLFNPFVYVAGTQALLLGLVFVALTTGLGYLNNSHFNGVLDYHKPPELLGKSILYSAGEQLIIIGCLTGLFYAAGLIFSKSAIRFIDVAGTMTLSRAPMLLSAIGGFAMPKSLGSIADITMPVILLSLAVILWTIWSIALAYNAFSVSCNIKGRRCTTVFIPTLIIAEAASILLCSLLYKSYL